MARVPGKLPFTATKGAVDVSEICLAICPFLASEHDRATPISFPHKGNRCVRHEIALERQLQFQKAYCLSDDHTDCYIFLQEGQQFAIKSHAQERKKRTYRSNLALPVILILVTFIVFLSLFFVGMNIQKVTAFNMSARMGFIEKIKPDFSGDDIQPAAQFEQNEAALQPAAEVDAPELEPGEDSLPAVKDSAAANQPANTEERGSFRAINYSE